MELTPSYSLFKAFIRLLQSDLQEIAREQDEQKKTEKLQQVMCDLNRILED